VSYGEAKDCGESAGGVYAVGGVGSCGGLFGG